MKRSEYEQRLEALEREIAALRRENVEDESERPPHQRPKLKCGEKYYYIEHDGVTFGYFWNNTDLDFGRLHIGNVFCTEEAAKYAAEYYTVLSEMREWAGQYNDPWKLISDGEIVDVSPLYNNDVLSGEMRFATQYDARNCIKAVGEDRLIKYYFGVRDHEADTKTAGL